MEVKPGYKQTDVGVIPEDWEAKPVGGEIDLITGYPFPSSGYKQSGIRLLRGSNVKRGETDWADDITQFWQSVSPDISRYELAEGDLVIAMDGSLVGRSYAQLKADDLPALLLQRVARIRSTKLDITYLTAFVGSERFVKYADSVKTVTAISHISPSDIRKFKISVPPTICEQRAIATALNHLDALLEALDRLIAKKRDLKQAAMQQLLTGRTRLPGFSGEWQVKQLGSEIADLEAGVSVNSVEDDFDNGSGPLAVLKTSAVANGRFIPSESKTVASRDLWRAKLSPRADSVIISRMNTIDLVGECGYVPADFPRLFVPDRLWMTRFKASSRVSAKWLAFVLSMPKSRLLIRNIATGTSGSMKNIAKGTFLALEFAFPDPDEQEAIANTLTDIDAELARLEQRQAKTRALKQGMMQELLTGKTRLVSQKHSHA